MANSDRCGKAIPPQQTAFPLFHPGFADFSEALFPDANPVAQAI